MRNVLFGACDAARVLAFYYVLNPFRQRQLNFALNLFVSDDVHCDVRVDHAQNRKIYVDDVIDFDNVFAPHVF